MNKTLQKKLNKATSKKTEIIVESENSSEELIDLMQEMKGAWNEAAQDLLQPRAEAVNQLLKKVLR